MRDKVFIKNLLRLALPICFQSFMLASVAAADAFMLGSVEQNLMSAVSLATQFQFVQNMLVLSTASAAVILGAQYWGRKDLKSVNEIFCLCLRICGLLSILFCIACSLMPETLMKLYTNEPELIKIGSNYLRIAGFSYLITGFSQCFLALMKVTDHVTTVAVISTTAVIVNIIFNAIFIYGFGKGAEGAALATLVARIVEIAIVLILSFNKKYTRPELKGLTYFNKRLSLDFLKVLWPLVGAYLLWGVGFTSYSSFMGHLGTDAAAANSITAVVRDLTCAACEGLAAGCGILVGNELGAGHLDTGKLYGDRMLKISFVIGFMSTLVMLIATPLVLLMVKLTDEARTYLLQMLIVMAIYMIGRSVNSILINGVFSAGGDTYFDMYSLVIVMWCLAVPLAALGTYVFHWPVIIVYACTCLDEVGKIPWVVYHFKKYKWVKDLTREREMENT